MDRGGKRISAENYIPAELCYIIFQKLPVRSLLSLRCVCKTWRSVIDDPTFVSTHLSLSKKTSIDHKLLLTLSPSQEGEKTTMKAVVHASSRDTYEFEASEEIPNSLLGSYELCAHIDGLLLLMTTFEMILWNPSIRKSHKLPPLPYKDSKHHEARILMGYDSLTDDYKVVRISPNPNSDESNQYSKLAVYGLKTRCWRISSSSNSKGFDNYNFQRWRSSKIVVYSKGLAHWLAHDKFGERSVSYTHIISFNFATETFSYTKLPSYEHVFIPFVRGDSLAVFCISPERSSTWVMVDDKDDGASVMEEVWSEHHNPWDSHIKESHEFFKYYGSIVKVLYVERDYHKILFKGHSNLICYDMVSNKRKILDPRFRTCPYIIPYVESLLLLGLGRNHIPS